MGKYCVYRSCKSHQLSKHSSAEGVLFFPVPKPKKNYEKCLRWVNAINRYDITVTTIKAHHYVCSTHFINGKGPTPEYPDPVKDIKQSSITLDHNYAYCFTDADIGSHDRIDAQSSELIKDQLVVTSGPQLHLPAILKPGNVRCANFDVSSPTHLVNTSRPNSHLVEIPQSNLVETLEPTLIASVDSEAYVNNVVTFVDLTKCDEPPENLEPTLIATVDSEDYVNNVVTSIVDLTKCDEPPDKTQIDIHPLKKVAHEFLVYQANNFDKCEWSIDVVQESLNYLTVPKLLTFRKISSNSLVILEILPTLKSTIKFCNKPISRDHILFSTSSVDYDKVIACLEDLMIILHEIENWRTCYGVQGELFSYFRDKYLKSAHFCLESQSIRSQKCHQLVMGVTARICPACRSTRKILVSRMKRKSQNNILDVKSTTNNRYMSPDEVNRKVTVLHKKNDALKRRVKLLEYKLKKSFQKEGIFLTEDESNDFEKLIQKNPFQCRTVFQKLLVREQLKLVTSKRKRPKKWHPAIIQWCLSIKAKSSSTYEAVRQVISLPSRRTLFNYSADLSTKSGFNDEVLLEMRQKIDIENLEEHQRFFSLIIDEIQVKQDLVFNSSTGELIGVTNLNEFRNKVNEMENRMKESTNDSNNQVNLASHILQFMVRGITTNIKFPYAYFPSGNNNAEDLYSLLWEAIENLHAAGFFILAVVCDKASSNQKLIKICTEMERKLNNHKVGFQSKNPFSSNGEPLYFVSDVCHNVKTAKTGLSNSGKLKKQKDGTKRLIRRLQKNGKFLLWDHVVKTYNRDCNSLLRLAPKLSYNHVYPNAFSCMRVKLATQVMSSSVANAMEVLVGEEASETVKFLRYFDKFFDIMNVSNVSSCEHQRKPALAPFTSKDDWRFKWLVEEFLAYLDEWEAEVEQVEVDELECDDGFDKSKMLLSKETLEGIRITVYATIEIVRFLLEKGAPFVLTSRLNQDSLENYFGRQRGACGSGENPTVNQYGQGTKRIKLMKTLMKNVTNGNCTVTKTKRLKRRKAASNALRDET